jgi:hypothetical protein
MFPLVTRSVLGRNSTAKALSHPNPDVQRFLLLYREIFAQHSPHGEKPYMMWSRDGELVRNLLTQFDYDRLVELLYAFFASEDTWVRKRGYALACFPTLIPTLLMEKPAECIRSTQAAPVVLHGPSDQHWQQASDSSSSTSLAARFPDLVDTLRRLSS